MPIIGEKLRTEIRAEMVNAFNHPIFQVPTGGTLRHQPDQHLVNGLRTRHRHHDTSARQFRVRFVF
jgi:hypothetical protein